MMKETSITSILNDSANQHPIMVNVLEFHSTSSIFYPINLIFYFFKLLMMRYEIVGDVYL